MNLRLDPIVSFMGLVGGEMVLLLAAMLFALAIRLQAGAPTSLSCTFFETFRGRAKSEGWNRNSAGRDKDAGKARQQNATRSLNLLCLKTSLLYLSPSLPS